MNIIKGKKKKPFKAIIYGPPGIGKSTLASKFGNPLFINLENGIHHLDVHSLDTIPKDYVQLDECLKFSYITRDYDTIVFDGLMHMEDILMDVVIKDFAKQDRSKAINAIGDISHGRGYQALNSKWRSLVSIFDSINKSGKNIIITGHSQTITFRNPLGEDFDRYTLNITKGGASVICSAMDAIFLMDWERFIETPGKGDLGGKSKGRGDGTRIVYTEERPAFVAKNRFYLPEKVAIQDDGKQFTDLILRG